jgi:hypothetical protein
MVQEIKYMCIVHFIELIYLSNSFRNPYTLRLRRESGCWLSLFYRKAVTAAISPNFGVTFFQHLNKRVVFADPLSNFDFSFNLIVNLTAFFVYHDKMCVDKCT